MPQVNPDDAANDEPKTYNDIGGDDRWQDSNDLNDIKGDLVDEDDGDPIGQSYDSKVSSRRNGEESHRNNDELDRDHQNDMGSTRQNIPYPMVSGLGSHPLFPNSLLPPSSQVPYSPYMGPYMGSFLCGTSSPLDLEGKQGPPRGPQSEVPSMYSLPGQLGQIPNPLAPWSPNPLYPLCTATMASMLRYPYPFHNFSSTSGGMGSVSPFPLVPPHPHAGGIHPNVLHPGGLPLPGHMLNGQNGCVKSLHDKKHHSESTPTKRTKSADKPNRPYVKKPLNAFMIYMKEQRAQVVAECTLKESAAINQILGRKWHSLNREEQQKYYEMARKERQIHMQRFPGWSARDNYGKRKKRKKEKTQDCTAQNPKKCRAVFGLEQQQLWCAPCRRKKKCIRYQHDGEDSDDSEPSPSNCQRSPQNYPNHTYSHSNSFDSSENSSTVQSSSNSAVATSNGQSTTSMMGESMSPNDLTLNDIIKQEKSPPIPIDQSVNCVKGSATEMFHPPSSFHPPSETSNNKSDSCGKKPLLHESSNNLNSPNGIKNRDFGDNSKLPLSNFNGFSAANKNIPNARNRRSDSQCDSLTNNSSNFRQSAFGSPLLSPPAMGLSSPHSNPHSFLSPQLSYLAAAASLPSPLSGLMGFSGLKGLGSPMGMGLGGDGTPIPPAGHPGSSAPRHPSSALEGKS